MAKHKFDLPAPATTATCRACGIERSLDAFRIFSIDPPLKMDFCIDCEQREGTTTLYRRYTAYGTEKIVDAVYHAERTPVVRRDAEQTRLLVMPETRRAPKSNEELIQQEIARRELCRRRLVYYVTTMTPTYSPGWVHQDICRRLEKFVKDVEEMKSPRLILAVPPRHGKSTLASMEFPSWVLGKHPDWPFVIASYAQELPVKFSRAIRDRLANKEYQAIFPDTKIRADARGVEAWETPEGGGVKAVGVGVGLTGHGARIAVCDDLLKDSEAASSDTIRDNTWEWYQTVLRTRIAPGGGILIIATRWHWHDPSGKAIEADLEQMKAGVPDYERENWEVVSYPAIAEQDEYLMVDGTIKQGVFDNEEGEVLRLLRRQGEALHPERYPINELRKVKNVLTTSNWSALYQQNPTPEEGDFFVRDDLRFRWLAPEWRPLTRRFLTVDYAIGKKNRNDFTVMAAFALDANDDLYVLEIRRGRWGTQQIADNAVAMVEAHKLETYAGEQGSIHHAVWPAIREALDKKRLYLTVDESLVPIQDKEVRARPLQGRVQRHKLFFSYDGSTRPDIYDITEREMLQFPNGANDDIVDALAWGARLALNLSLPSKTEQHQARKSWQDKLRANSGGGSNFMAA